MSKPFQLAALYAQVWSRYFEGRFKIGSGECKAAKELLDLPQDEILEKARIHCTDLWHKENCKGSLFCFVKNYNSFTIPKKPEKIRQRITCNRCEMDHWLDEKHDCAPEAELLTPNEGIKLLMKRYEIPG